MTTLTGTKATITKTTSVTDYWHHHNQSQYEKSMLYLQKIQ